MAIRKPKYNIYCNEHSYRVTDEWLEEFCHEPSTQYRPEENNRDIGAGSWILVNGDIPVQDPKPQVAGVYYATPAIYGESVGYRKDGKYLIDIYVQKADGTIAQVKLYPSEYIVVTDEIMQVMNEDDVLIPTPYTSAPILESVNEDLWREKYNTLSEDDRNIADAYMVDGLSFHQACSMYFSEKYVDNPGHSFWYMPKDQLRYLFWN